MTRELTGIPPFVPPDRPQPTPPTVYPPVPMVYERPAVVDALADRLLERRTVLISGTLDLPAATDASARLMLLDGNGDDPIDLVLSCPDGGLVAAMALADTVELVGVEVRALCSGSIGGAAVLPFALASRRLAQPHAVLRLSDPEHEVQGRATHLADEAAHYARLLADFHARVAQSTGHTLDETVADFARNRILTAPEARSYGLVDEIVHRRGLRSLS